MVLLAVGNVDLSPTRPELPENRPISVSSDGYVSSQACRSCHPQEHRSWHESYHSTMTQLASPETVVGNFDDQLLVLHDREYFLHREGDKFVCDMDMPGWDELLQRNPQGAARLRGQKPPPFRGEIVMTTGSHHMQAYWYATKQSRMLAPLPFVYLIDQQKWIPADASFLNEPSHFVAAEFGRWNTTCLKCHSTHPRARIASQTEMDTEVGEFGIACESCHGPGEEHVKANRNPQRRYSLRMVEEGDPTIVNPARLNHELSSQVCGHCHSVTYQPPAD